jgi:hypothetical protein
VPIEQIPAKAIDQQHYETVTALQIQPIFDVQPQHGRD